MIGFVIGFGIWAALVLFAITLVHGATRND
jgi:hypothetical protein